jgi:hypothetical protein
MISSHRKQSLGMTSDGPVFSQNSNLSVNLVNQELKELVIGDNESNHIGNGINPGNKNHHIVIAVTIGMKKLSVQPILRNSAAVVQTAIIRI